MSNLKHKENKHLIQRPFDLEVIRKLEEQGVHPLLATLYAARGVRDISDINATLKDLLPISTLTNCVEMSKILADCIERQNRVQIVSDYDCDGATSCAVLLYAFKKAGMNVGFMVPDREIHGYGLTETIVDEIVAQPEKTDFIVTVDNGISSVDGVRHAAEFGIEVLVTDHHLAPEVMPKARLIVNPNQPNCAFASKGLAGCGVAWYLTVALHRELKQRGREPGFEPAELLQFVAIGTVADMVKLDKNNRILVSDGLRRIRRGQCTAGIKALCDISGKPWSTLSCMEIGFDIGPRINAAGRLKHMSTGIECLMCEDDATAKRLAKELHETNVARKMIQKEMLADAKEFIDQELLSLASSDRKTRSIVLFKDAWHEGVVGVVAGRIKDEFYRPTFVLCRAKDGSIKGSGRSIEGFHLRDAIAKISETHPKAIAKFGGHAPAAGITINEGYLDIFREALEKLCQEWLSEEDLKPKMSHDGPLPEMFLNVGTVQMLDAEVWGQGFEQPMFADTLAIDGHRLMGDPAVHLKLFVSKGETPVELVAFNEAARAESLGQEVFALFKPEINSYNGNTRLQLKASYLPDEDDTISPCLVRDYGASVGPSDVSIDHLRGTSQSKPKGFRRL